MDYILDFTLFRFVGHKDSKNKRNTSLTAKKKVAYFVFSKACIIFATRKK